MAVTYTRLAVDPQTAWARHLDAIRRQNDWSATELYEDAHKRVLGPKGILGPKSLTSFKPVLMAKPMPEAWANALAELYGTPAAEAPVTETVDQSDVAAAIREQTAALVALLDAANRRADAAERRLDALETLMLRTTSSEPSLAQVDADAQAWAEGTDTTSPSRRPAHPAGRG